MLLLWKILKANRASVGFMALFATLQVSLVVLGGSAAVFYREFFEAFSWLQWVFFYLGVALLMSLSLVPTTFVAFLSGFFLGFHSVPFVIVSYVTASMAGYFIARRVDNGNFIKSVSDEPKVMEVLNNLRQNHLSIIILARMSPILPFAIMNILLCVAGVDFRRFLLGGAIGMLPRTLFTIWVGWQARQINLFSPEHSTQTYVQLLLVIISLAGIYYFFNKALKKQQKRRPD